MQTELERRSSSPSEMHSGFKTDYLNVVFCVNIRKHSVLSLKFRGLAQHYSITWDGTIRYVPLESPLAAPRPSL